MEAKLLRFLVSVLVHSSWDQVGLTLRLTSTLIWPLSISANPISFHLIILCNSLRNSTTCSSLLNSGLVTISISGQPQRLKSIYVVQSMVIVLAVSFSKCASWMLMLCSFWKLLLKNCKDQPLIIGSWYWVIWKPTGESG